MNAVFKENEKEKNYPHVKDLTALHLGSRNSLIAMAF